MKLNSVESVVRELNSAGVKFIVVGGLAVAAHGFGRFTADLDLVIHLEPDSIRRTFEALRALGYRPRVPITADAFADPERRARWVSEKQMSVLAFDSEQQPDTPVDVFVSDPFDFDEEYAQAIVHEIAGDVPLRVVRLAALLEMKRIAGRPQDLADIAELRRRQSEIAEHGDDAWSVTTWEGNRRYQRQMFRAKSFHDKVEAIEAMAAVRDAFGDVSRRTSG
ncbi:MAG: nucleotidyl transferase AbiEii/AbiGii toxin family protein [Gemmatimonadales bacterium]